jgi:hypothetical protein
MDKFLNNKLKEISPEKIQKAIAKAIQELNGVEYTVDIKSIEYGDSFFDGGKMNLSISKTPSDCKDSQGT